MGRAIVALFTFVAGCDGLGNPPPTLVDSGDADADTDADSDADTDVDGDTDADTDTEPTTPPLPGETAIRVVHAASALPPQDMVVNDNLPPVLNDLVYGDGTLYSPRPPNLYTFQFKDGSAALDEAWTTFDYELLDGRRHTFVVFGTTEQPDVLPLLDDDLAIASDQVRIRWTHAAPALPSPLDVYDVITGDALRLGLAYGASIELDLDPVEIQVGVDGDADAVADWVFESFERTGGEYFHVIVNNDADGTPYLLGQTAAGATPRRELLP